MEKQALLPKATRYGWWLVIRRILSVLAGIIAVIVLSYGTDAVLEAVGVLPRGMLPQYGSDLLILTVLAYRTMYNVIGCYIAARLAPDHPMGHALGLGVLGFVGSIAGAVVGRDLAPAWYLWMLVVLALPCAWLGGKLFALGSGGR